MLMIKLKNAFVDSYCKFRYKFQLPDCLLQVRHPREKEMATHSSILAWSILWTEEPGGLLSMGSHRVGHN